MKTFLFVIFLIPSVISASSNNGKNQKSSEAPKSFTVVTPGAKQPASSIQEYCKLKVGNEELFLTKGTKSLQLKLFTKENIDQISHNLQKNLVYEGIGKWGDSKTNTVSLFISFTGHIAQSITYFGKPNMFFNWKLNYPISQEQYNEIYKAQQEIL